MKKIEFYQSKEKLLEGYKDASAGRYIKSSGDFKQDLKEFKNREKNGW